MGSSSSVSGKPNQEDVPWDKYVWRLCVSYRKLNQVTRPFTYPVPRCDEAVLDIGPNAKCFLSMDLDAGYWQIELEQHSRSKTAFFTPAGKKRWRVMPMGYLNSHSIFVAMMATLKVKWDLAATKKGLQPSFFGSKVIVDDILVIGKGATYEEAIIDHDRKIHQLFKRLEEKNITLNKDKCNFKKESVKYMGHIITKDGVTSDPEKVKAINEIKRPKNVKDLKTFLGMVGYMSKFIPQLAEISEPLRILERK